MGIFEFLINFPLLCGGGSSHLRTELLDGDREHFCRHTAVELVVVVPRIRRCGKPGKPAFGQHLHLDAEDFHSHLCKKLSLGKPNRDGVVHGGHDLGIGQPAVGECSQVIPDHVIAHDDSQLFCLICQKSFAEQLAWAGTKLPTGQSKTVSGASPLAGGSVCQDTQKGPGLGFGRLHCLQLGLGQASPFPDHDTCSIGQASGLVHESLQGRPDNKCAHTDDGQRHKNGHLMLLNPPAHIE